MLHADDLVPAEDVRTASHLSRHPAVRPARIVREEDSVVDEVLRMAAEVSLPDL